MSLLVVWALSAQRVLALGTIVPAYFYPSPGSPWARLTEAAGQIPVVAIMNPGNGPGSIADANYTAAVLSLQAAQGRVIGYVYTSYTGRSLNDVKADISKYLSLYPSVDGFFLDEATNDALVAHQTYYLSLKQYIRSQRPGAMIVGNPGTQVVSNYLAAMDALVTFENGTGYMDYVPDAWTSARPATNLSHLCYAIPSAAAMTNTLLIAAARNVGWVFVTHDVLPNPWDSLPPYWEAEVGFIASLNRPRLVLSRAEGSACELRVVGVPWRYATETSTDLQTWASGTTNWLGTPGGMSLFFTNWGASQPLFLRSRFVFW